MPKDYVENPGEAEIKGAVGASRHAARVFLQRGGKTPTAQQIDHLAASIYTTAAGGMIARGEFQIAPENRAAAAENYQTRQSAQPGAPLLDAAAERGAIDRAHEETAAMEPEVGAVPRNMVEPPARQSRISARARQALESIEHEAAKFLAGEYPTTEEMAALGAFCAAMHPRTADPAMVRLRQHLNWTPESGEDRPMLGDEHLDGLRKIVAKDRTKLETTRAYEAESAAAR